MAKGENVNFSLPPQYRSALFLLALALLVSAGAARAQSSSSGQLEVTQTEVNNSTNQITITGVNFGTSLPSVTLAGAPLNVVSSTPTQIVADLPSGIQPGTYLLKVARGNGTSQTEGRDRCRHRQRWAGRAAGACGAARASG